MTQLVGTNGNLSSGLADTELLQRLIKEGLSPSGEGGEAECRRYRKLLEVLFQACIISPTNRSPSPSSLEQAGYTLAILSRQTKARPELLSSVPPLPESQVPLYKWIVPRLISAAVRYEEMEGAESLVEDLITAAVHVLHVLGRDLSDEETSFAKGPRRVIVVVKRMMQLCLRE